MLSFNDPEMLRLFIEQRREELRRSMEGSGALRAWLPGAARRSVGPVQVRRRATRMRPSKRTS